jgi:hypothetical protein
MTAIDTISGTILDGVTVNKNAPIVDPISAIMIRSGSRRRVAALGGRNGRLPPRLMKVSANILVATATRASIPTWNITGTVMIDVLPVTTLTALVAKKTTIKTNN